MHTPRTAISRHRAAAPLPALPQKCQQPLSIIYSIEAWSTDTVAAYLTEKLDQGDGKAKQKSEKTKKPKTKKPKTKKASKK